MYVHTYVCTVGTGLRGHKACKERNWFYLVSAVPRIQGKLRLGKKKH